MYTGAAGEQICVRRRLTPAQAKERREKWELGYDAMSRDAWVTLTLQAVRIFVLARVTPKSFSSLPGVLLPVARAAKGADGKAAKGPSADPELVDSNVYSVRITNDHEASITNHCESSRIIHHESSITNHKSRADGLVAKGESIARSIDPTHPRASV